MGKNTDRIVTQTEVWRGLGKKKQKEQAKKRVWQKLGSRLEYGLNVDSNMD